jgi:hypothetical protein
LHDVITSMLDGGWGGILRCGDLDARSFIAVARPGPSLV